MPRNAKDLAFVIDQIQIIIIAYLTHQLPGQHVKIFGGLPRHAKEAKQLLQAIVATYFNGHADINEKFQALEALMRPFVKEYPPKGGNPLQTALCDVYDVINAMKTRKEVKAFQRTASR